MTPSVSLRAATGDDTEFLAAVYASTRMEELTATDWDDAQKTEFCRMQFVAQDAHYRQHYPTAEFCVIEAGGNSVGRLYVDRWTREIRIMDIAILPEYRGKGIGSHLLLELQRQAAASERSLSIHVERFNPALSLYERLGFRLLEDKGVYLLLEWTA
ncbi:MAG: GNAT family N-acetyltransferase [Luteolibacter sp.]|uniref:GNAT family N-acetyltransferase n=1 Tax=Luteolibacter sp. TaxID=1962973 RepID=UPI003263F927